ncbi:toxin-antitoxin system, antitoxin component, ribbon-helix-helix domain protein [Cooperia oncophora]
MAFMTRVKLHLQLFRSEDAMSLWRRPRSPSWSMDSYIEDMSRRIDRALEECRRDMRRFEESFFPRAKYGEAQRVSTIS